MIKLLSGKSEERMHKITKQVLFWGPRIFCILFALFLSMFALDVIGEGYGYKEKILALLIHLIPTYIIIILLIIGWHWEWAGSILFIIAALFFFISSKGKIFVIYGPLFLLGVLFLLSWKYKSHHKS